MPLMLYDEKLTSAAFQAVTFTSLMRFPGKSQISQQMDETHTLAALTCFAHAITHFEINANPARRE